MKKLIIVLGFLSALSIISCKKDEEVKEKTTLEKIQAKWSVENITIHYADTSIPFDTTDVYNGSANDYFDFRADGKAYIMVDGESDTSTYGLSGDSTILFAEFGSYKIQALNDNSLKLFVKEELDEELLEQTINLKK